MRLNEQTHADATSSLNKAQQRRVRRNNPHTSNTHADEWTNGKFGKIMPKTYEKSKNA